MSASPDEQYRACTDALLEALDAAIEGWIRRVVEARIPRDWGDDRRADIDAELGAVARQIHEGVLPRLRDLLTADVDQQHTGPLDVLRTSVGPANRLLAEAGVPEVQRDPFTAERFPEDPYDLGPANFDDVDASLHDPGLEWGAAKAHVVLARHKGT